MDFPKLKIHSRVGSFKKAGIQKKTTVNDEIVPVRPASNLRAAVIKPSLIPARVSTCRELIIGFLAV